MATLTTASNGLPALAELQEQSYRVIVCDVKMNFLGGMSFYRELQDSYPDMDDRVVFVTGW